MQWRNAIARRFAGQKGDARLLSDDALRLARANYMSSPPLEHDAGDRWSYYLQRMRTAIEGFPSAEAAITFAHTSSAGFDHRGKVTPLIVLYEIDLMRKEFPSETDLINSVSDSTLVPQETVMIDNGRLISNILLFDLRHVIISSQVVGKRGLKVCEIGGGNGLPCYTWFASDKYRPAQYSIVDFRESLFFQETFLRMNFPDARMHYVTSRSENSEIERADIVFCPIEHRVLLQNVNFDLVVNTGSMAEMTEGWAEEWMNWLDQSSAKYFYSANYFGTSLAGMGEATNFYSPKLSNAWRARFLETNSPLVMLHSGRRFAIAVYEKASEDVGITKGRDKARFDATEGRFLSDAVLLEAMDALRTYNDEDDAYRLLNRCMTERFEIPKEAVHLLRLAARSEKHDLNEIRALLDRMTAQGIRSQWHA